MKPPGVYTLVSKLEETSISFPARFRSRAGRAGHMRHSPPASAPFSTPLPTKASDRGSVRFKLTWETAFVDQECRLICFAQTTSTNSLMFPSTSSVWFVRTFCENRVNFYAVASTFAIVSYPAPTTQKARKGLAGQKGRTFVSPRNVIKRLRVRALNRILV